MRAQGFSNDKIGRRQDEKNARLIYFIFFFSFYERAGVQTNKNFFFFNNVIIVAFVFVEVSTVET